MALSEEDKKEIATLIAAQMVESMKATENKTTEIVKTALAGLKIDEKIEAVKAAQQQKPVETTQQPDPSGKAADPEIAKLKAQLDDLNRKAAESSRRAEESEAARRNEALVNAVRDALASAGADSKRLGVAINHLRATGLVALNDKGEPCFKEKKSWGDEMVSVSDGAKNWLNTEEGKIFVPPVNTQGTGPSSGTKAQGGGGGGAPADPNEILQQSLRDLGLFI